MAFTWRHKPADCTARAILKLFIREHLIEKQPLPAALDCKPHSHRCKRKEGLVQALLHSALVCNAKGSREEMAGWVAPSRAPPGPPCPRAPRPPPPTPRPLITAPNVAPEPAPREPRVWCTQTVANTSR